MSTTASDVDLEQVDLMDEDLFDDGPPHELFARHARRGAGAQDARRPRVATSGR